MSQGETKGSIEKSLRDPITPMKKKTTARWHGPESERPPLVKEK